MKTITRRARHAATLASVLAFTAAGCQGAVEDTDAEVAEIEAAIEQENGGLEPTDEAPMFGMEDQFEEAELPEPEEAIEDVMAGSPEVQADENAPAAVRIRATVVWGQIPGNPEAEKGRDWSGTLKVSRGALLVRRLVAFEKQTDKLLPRKDKSAVSFTSLTKPHRDGLRIDIIDPTPEADEPLVLSYEDANGKVFEAPIGALVDGPKTKVVDDAGNRVVAMARPQPLDPCNHGTLGGKWDPLKPGIGKLLGVVRNDDGDPIGHMHGIYGTRKDGEQVFFGKYVDLDGKFRGIYKGGYEEGLFHGRWLHASGDVGGLGGMYREDKPGPQIGGHYLGRWAETSCNVPFGPGEMPPEL